MKSLVLRTINALGYDLVRREPAKVEPADEKLQALISRRDPVIFDVGANLGQSITRFRRLFPQAFIHSFEPNPETFAKLAPYESPQISLQQLAISDSEGESIFFLGPSSKMDSLHKINTDSMNYDLSNVEKKFGKSKSEFTDRTNTEIKVRKTTLDAYCAMHDVGQIDILKIDTQGHESAVLAGAVNILPRTGVILIEISFWDLYETQTDFFEIERRIRGAGFRLFALHRVVHEKRQFKRLAWVDAMYVNRNLHSGLK